MPETQTPIENPLQSQPPKSHWHFHLPTWGWVSILIVVAFGVGYWAWMASLEDQVTVDSTQNAVVDEIADWQTYRNEEFGFEFKYPKDWFYDDPGCSPYYDGRKFSMDFHEPGCENIKFILNINFPIRDYSGYCGEPLKIENRIHSNYSLERVQFCDGDLAYKINKENNQLFFQNLNLDNYTFDQIRSTFRFIESDPFSAVKSSYPGITWTNPIATQVAYYDYQNSESYTLEGYKIESDIIEVEFGDFYSYYDESLKSEGWEEDLNLAADGPGSSRWGYKKGNERIILTQKPEALPEYNEHSFTIMIGILRNR